MSDPVLQSIIQYIERKIGLKSQSISLLIWKRAIKERMILCGIPTQEDYLKKLQHSFQETQELIELIVIPETWFFRDKAIYEFLKTVLNIKHLTVQKLRILSIACSTGEEPYSIAMTLFDLGLLPTAFTIDAFDISKNAITKAKAGIYKKNSFRGKDIDFRNRYFSEREEGLFVIKEKVKRQVNFFCYNILNPNIRLENKPYHFIFCRHLLIYLDSTSQALTLEKLKQWLHQKGYLIVAPEETYLINKESFTHVHFPKSCAFSLNMLPQPATKSTRKFPSMLSEKKQILDRETIIHKAVRLADQGLLEESTDICLNYLSRYGAHPQIFYLLGLIQHALGKERQAENFFLKTVYLSPEHYEALIYLSLLYKKRGETEQADLFAKRAEKIKKAEHRKL